MVWYNQGGGSGGTTVEADPTKFLSVWSAARASDYPVNVHVLGSDGDIYYRNPDTGGGIPGDASDDPVAGDGSSTSSWVKKVAVASSDQNTTFVKLAGNAPAGVPAGMPTGEDAEDGDFHTREYDDYLIYYSRNVGAWVEDSRIAKSQPSTNNAVVIDTDGELIEIGRTHRIDPPAVIVPGITYEAPEVNVGDPVQYALNVPLPAGGAEGDVFWVSVTETPDDLPVHINGNVNNDPEGTLVFRSNGWVPFYYRAGTWWSNEVLVVSGDPGTGGTGDVTKAELASSVDDVIIHGGVF